MDGWVNGGWNGWDRVGSRAGVKAIDDLFLYKYLKNWEMLKQSIICENNVQIISNMVLD